MNLFNESAVDYLEAQAHRNGTGAIDDGVEGPLGFWPSIVIGSLLLLLILCCVVGNFFVILAILVERDLRSRPQYYLIFSLAIADLLVGLIVTPLGAWATIRRAWHLGVTLCDFWISVDVLVCTSSILHLVAIALDRYWSITDIYYVQNRTPRRIFFMLMSIWVLSLLISLAPIFGWKDAQFVTRVQEQHVCLISQQISYQVFSTATAFYIPLSAIIIVYYKIMRAARNRFRRDRDRRTVHRAVLDQNGKGTPKTQRYSPPMPAGIAAAEAMDGSCKTINLRTENGHPRVIKLKYEEHNGNGNSDDEYTPIHTPAPGKTTETELNDSIRSQSEKANGGGKRSSVRISVGKRKKRVKESIENRRERKAWRTLAIITGTFVACWTPFFLISLYRPICNCRIPPVLESVTTWLGYLNSALNPVIYTIFSQDFRAAFGRILKRMFFMNPR
ncbi:Protein SER-4 [Aphelenchoides avenae]|nr:Protein SER-4 [Aphelenchus avenae]